MSASIHPFRPPTRSRPVGSADLDAVAIPPAELERMATTLYAGFCDAREFWLRHPCERTRRAMNAALQAHSLLMSGQEVPVAEFAP